MKKIIYLLEILLMLSGLIFSQSLNITSPHSGQAWYKGKTYTITWTKSGTMNNKVKIRLMQGGTKILGITDSTANNGSYSWTIPSSVANGSYYIRVKTIDNAVFDDGSIFNIETKLPKLKNKTHIPKLSNKSHQQLGKKLVFSIKISEPQANKTYVAKTPIKIMWNKNIGGYDKVNIFLYGTGYSGSDHLIATLFTGVNNTGVITWENPTQCNFPPVKWYIKISTPDNKISGKSGPFNVEAPPVQPPTPKSKVIAVSPKIENKFTSNVNHTSSPECLSVSIPLPGRPPHNELKTGHYIWQGKQGDCNWTSEYYFFSNLSFDLNAVRGKKIIRAEILISLSDSKTNIPNSGSYATNKYCSSSSRIFIKDTFIKKFTILSDGDKAKVNLLDTVQKWANSNSSEPFTLTIKGMKDSVDHLSICLRYYASQPLLMFVEYEE